MLLENSSNTFLSSIHSTSITITNQFELQSVQASSSSDILFMTTLRAPELVENSSRKPIDLVCVIDKSGSMAGSKLELVKQTLQFLVQELQVMDRMSIITFDTEVTTELGLTELTATNKQMVQKIIQRIHSGSSTNLSGGLFKGLETLAERGLKNEVASVLLLTDGHANKGVISEEGILNGMNSIISNQIKQAVSVHTFGFGEDHNPNLLRRVAQAASGMYYFVEKEEGIPEAFADCLGGLTSVVAQNITLSLKTLNGCNISSLPSSHYKYTLENNNQTLQLTIGDLYSEEKKNLLVQLTLPSISAANPKFPIAHLTLSYFNILTSQLEKKDFLLEIPRVETPDASPPNFELDKQRNRIICANALSLAREQADLGNLSEGRATIEQAIAKINQSVSGSDAYCQALIMDLQYVLETMHHRSLFQSKGSKMASNMQAATSSERSTTLKESSTTPIFETSSKKRMKGISMEYFSPKRK